MKDKHYFTIIVGACLALLGALNLEGAPRRSTYESESETVIRELRDNVENLKHEISNHENEIRSFEDKVRNQDATVEALRQQLHDSNKSQKDQLQENTAELEVKVKSIETLTKTLVSDAKQLKNSINEITDALTQVTTALTQYTQRISKLEKVSDTQAQNIASLDSALESVLEAFQVKENISSPSPEQKLYCVKPGDSLEKIARHNNTTIQTIKDLNQLLSDKIVIGQKLKLCKE